MCIDQRNITKDLQLLPIFLASCRSFLVLAGDTYTSRLWCMLELFVFLTMRSNDVDGSHPDANDTNDMSVMPMKSEAQGITVLPLIEGTVTYSFLQHQWTSFNTEDCDCHDQEDRRKILQVISQTEGGIADFNLQVTQLLKLTSRQMLSEGDAGVRLLRRGSSAINPC
jgi:hypothetical protein